LAVACSFFFFFEDIHIYSTATINQINQKNILSVSQSQPGFTTASEISLAASCGLPHEERTPLKHMISDRKNEKLKVQRIQRTVNLI